MSPSLISLLGGPATTTAGTPTGGSSPKTKVKYTCPGCKAKTWGKPNLHIICGDCSQTMKGGE